MSSTIYVLQHRTGRWPFRRWTDKTYTDSLIGAAVLMRVAMEKRCLRVVVRVVGGRPA